jgi:hypothetical protein
MGFSNPVVGGTALRIPAIQSPNFQTGVAGWIIRIDGSAEFNNLTIRGTFNGNNFILNSDGLFIYSGTPANGNLIASIAPVGGTDGFGNTYLQGIVSYTGGAFAALAAGNLLLGLTANGYPTAGLVGLSGTDAVFASSPTSVSNTEAATWELVDGLTSVTPQSAAGYPHLDVGASSAGTTGWINGAWVRSTVSAGTSTAETWHNPSYNANWSGTTTFGTISGGLRTLQYRKDAEDNLWLNGTFTAAAGAGSSVFQLPAGYRPVVNGAFPVAFISSGGTAGNAWMYVSAAGNLNINSQLGSAVTTGTAYYVNGKIPLGNIG